MTTLEYMQAHRNENLGWCKPYIDKTGKYAVVFVEDTIDAVYIDGEEYHGNDCMHALIKLAIAVNPDFKPDLPLIVLASALQYLDEHGCIDCPFRTTCGVMNEDIE